MICNYVCTHTHTFLFNRCSFPEYSGLGRHQNPQNAQRPLSPPTHPNHNHQQPVYTYYRLTVMTTQGVTQYHIHCLQIPDMHSQSSSQASQFTHRVY